MSDQVAEAPDLFDLFREFECYELTDPKGRTTTIGMRALDYFENQQLLEKLDKARQEARKEYDNPDNRAILLKDLEQLTPQQIIDAIVTIEAATVGANADLAPPAEDGDEKLSPEEREKKATAKWEAERRKQLAEGGQDVAKANLVELQVRSVIMMRAAETLVTQQLLTMVQNPFCPVCDKRVTLDKVGKWKNCPCGKWPPPIDDPLPTFKKALSDKKDDPRYIGKLMPATRRQLNELRTKFLAGQGEKETRKAAETPAFLQSGGSPNESTDSPGATGATQQGSQLPLQVSTP